MPVCAARRGIARSGLLIRRIGPDGGARGQRRTESCTHSPGIAEDGEPLRSRPPVAVRDHTATSANVVALVRILKYDFFQSRHVTQDAV
jgi:hypothetical protein